MQPKVSVIIPTRNRPLLVTRAVQSVLQQTLKEIEVIIVIDGKDDATSVELAKIDDPRLQTLQLPVSKGGAVARNAGVAQSRGEWIAFLDDDDEWLPQKLELQLEAAMSSQYSCPIISCCLISRTPKGEFKYPRRFPQPAEPLSEYLLARNSFSFGEGLIQTSTIFTKKELLQKVPFQEGLAKHQDWDWILHANVIEDVGIEFVPESLAIWYRWEKRQTTSSTSNWQNSLTWIRENRHLVTPRAYSAFVMVQVGSQAAYQRQWQEFLPLLRESINNGKPKAIDFLLYLGMWLIPRDARRSLRGLLGKNTQSLSSA
ncbi:MAG: glycosyltransferase family 2 protein [Xenococcaceae cyanobacterium MO_207.B15]|nr:glycosyltransferase family 2 protein [Xenococcaceae cyanobacterium MO_207.B15]